METPEIKEVCVKEESDPIRWFSVEPIGGEPITIEETERLSKAELKKIIRNFERMREILNGGVQTLDESIEMLLRKISTSTCN